MKTPLIFLFVIGALAGCVTNNLNPDEPTAVDGGKAKLGCGGQGETCCVMAKLFTPDAGLGPDVYCDDELRCVPPDGGVTRADRGTCSR